MIHAAEALSQSIKNKVIREGNFNTTFFPKSVSLIEDKIKEATLSGKTYITFVFDLNFRIQIGFSYSLSDWTQAYEQMILNEIRKAGYIVDEVGGSFSGYDIVRVRWNEVRA